MQNLIFIITLCFFAFSSNASVWYYGNGEAVNLENKIGFDQHGQKIITGTVTDPLAISASASAGSIYLRTNGDLYKKNDNGNTTNWEKFIFGGDVDLKIATATQTVTNDYLQAIATATQAVTNDYLQAIATATATERNITLQAIATATSTLYLNNLVDVDTTTATLNYVLAYNGAQWVPQANNAPQNGQEYLLFFDDTPSDIVTYYTLSATATGGTEVDDSATSSGSVEVLIEAYASRAIGGTYIDGGPWQFDYYAYVSSSVGNNILRSKVYRRNSTGTEFFLFQLDTPDISSQSLASPEFISTYTFQPSFSASPTDRLVVKVYAVSDSVVNRTIHFLHNGTQHYSHIHTSFIIRHNQLAGLQGCSGDECYHTTLYQNQFLQGATQSNVVGNVYTVTGSGTYAFQTPSATFDASTASITGYSKSLNTESTLTATMSVNKAFASVENRLKANQHFEARSSTQQVSGELGSYKYAYAGTGSTTPEIIFSVLTQTASISGYPDGIVAYWNMDGASSATETNQYQPGTYDLTNVGTAIRTNVGLLGTSRGFGWLSNTNYLRWDSSSQSNTDFDNTSFIVGGWYKLPAGGDHDGERQFMIGKTSNFTSDGWALMARVASGIGPSLWRNGSECAAGYGLINDANFHHIMGQRNASESFTKVWVDGTLRATCAVGSFTPVTNNLIVGADLVLENTSASFLLDDFFYVGGTYTATIAQTLATRLYNSATGRLVSQAVDAMTGTSTQFTMLKKGILNVTQNNVNLNAGEYNIAWKNNQKILFGSPMYTTSATSTASYNVFGDVGDYFEFGATNYTNKPSILQINATEF